MARSMDKVNSIGLISPLKIQRVMISWSIMKDNGGEDYLTAKGSIRRSMVTYIWVSLKMDWSTAKERNGSQMVTIIRVNSWMDYQKDMESMFGKIAVHLKVILNMVFGMVTAFGKRTIKRFRCIKGIMLWIKRQATEFITGRVDGTIKVTFRTIIATDMDNCMMVKENLVIVDFGRMERRVRDR